MVDVTQVCDSDAASAAGAAAAGPGGGAEHAAGRAVLPRLLPWSGRGPGGLAGPAIRARLIAHRTFHCIVRI